MFACAVFAGGVFASGIVQPDAAGARCTAGMFC